MKKNHQVKHRVFPKKEEDFIATRKELKSYYDFSNIVVIASPGRSASTLLTEVMKKYAVKYNVLKTHLLPPSTKFKGKILFIFSNPDKAAESALHRVLHSPSHGATHFLHVETSDRVWFEKIGRNANNQTEKNNLLTYDALGYTAQLEEWLYRKSQPCSPQEAQILAIKYEHLWEPGTIQAIADFLTLDTIQLPPKRARGYDSEKMTEKEVSFKALHNIGTAEEPIYKAYDKARELWKQAPPLQFLKIIP